MGTILGANATNVDVRCVGAPSLSLAPLAVKTLHFSWEDTEGETEYRLLESVDGIAPLTPVVSVAANRTNHDLVVPLFLRLRAHYSLQSCNGATCNESQPVSVPGSLAGAIGYFKASNGEAGDLFGASIALSADGNTLVVGAVGEASSASGIGGDQTYNSALESGAVYIFSRSGTGWSQQAYIKASNTGTSDYFGRSIALAADGNTLAVGAPREASSASGFGGNQFDNSALESGAVYLFSRSGMAWSQQAYVKASNAGAGDVFGTSVALSADGRTLAVGAPYEGSNSTGVGGDQTDNSASESGAVYVFSTSGTAWSQQAYVKASNTGAGDNFGDSVTLSADGNTLAVGATGEASSATSIGGDQSDNSAGGSGAIYVFSRSGTAWSQQAYVKASNAGAGDVFGISAALSADGNTLAVGARSEDSNATGIGANQADNTAAQAGAAYVFARSGTAWSQVAYVKASNTEAGDFFGGVVALSADGTILVVGASDESSSATGIEGNQADNSALAAGAVYVFLKRVTGWSQQAYVKASNTRQGKRFGTSIGLSADGKTLAVGSERDGSNATGIGGNQNDNTAAYSGAVYVY